MPGSMKSDLPAPSKYSAPCAQTPRPTRYQCATGSLQDRPITASYRPDDARCSSAPSDYVHELPRKKT